MSNTEATEETIVYNNSYPKETEFISKHREAINNPMFIPTSIEDLRTQEIYKKIASWRNDTFGILAMVLIGVLTVVFLIYTGNRLTGLGIIGWIKLVSMVLALTTIFALMRYKLI
jgi:hypothetical protein